MVATLAYGAGSQSGSRRFHLRMAVVFVLIAFGGFTPTYWAPLAAGRFHAPPIAHIHGLLLFSWTVFYLAQTAWVASGRVATHRAWGLAGISLFSVLICSIIVLKITMMRLDDAHGFGDATRRFAAVVFCSLPVMIALFVTAIANVRNPDTHRRLMYVLMCGLMIPALARVFITYLAPPGALDGGPPPPFVAVPPAVVSAMLVGVAIVHDWRTRGRPHAAYLYGGLAMFLINVVAVFVARTATWMNIAGMLQALGG